MRECDDRRANGWPTCTVCNGRIHHPKCTSKRNKQKDCCPARHKMLHDAGQIFGLSDLSVKMWEKGDLN